MRAFVGVAALLASPRLSRAQAVAQVSGYFVDDGPCLAPVTTAQAALTLPDGVSVTSGDGDAFVDVADPTAAGRARLRAWLARYPTRGRRFVILPLADGPTRTAWRATCVLTRATVAPRELRLSSPRPLPSPSVRVVRDATLAPAARTRVLAGRPQYHRILFLSGNDVFHLIAGLDYIEAHPVFELGFDR